MHYTIRWPDATESVCYSPSLVIQDYFVPGRDYALDQFVQRLREATAIASERVRAKYGYACSRAAEQLLRIESQAAAYADQSESRVHMVAFGPADD
jgi:uncharacterized repeat protein (TIGR04042 family)